LTCKFVLSDVSEKQISSGEGYNIFEPTVALEIDGRNVFETLGIDGAKSVVVMASRERFIETTVKLIEELSEKDDGFCEYWLLGTGLGFRLERKGRILEVFLRVDNWGPTQGVSSPQTVRIGTVPISEWVESIASLSRTLSNMVRRLNPELYHDPLFQKEEANLSLIERWLRTGRNA